MSPDALCTLTPPATSRTLTSPLALLTLTPPSTRSASTSPDAVAMFMPPIAPRTSRSAERVRAVSSEPSGQRTRQVMPWRLKRFPRLNPLRFCGSVDQHARALQLDPRVVDELLSLVVVGDQLHLDAAVERRVDLDVAGVQPDLDLGRSLDFECLLHRRTSSSALGVAREALAADMDGARLGRAGDRADEPRVRRDPLGVGCLLDRRLQGLG